MHVALHHDAVVPPVHYGGTERVVHWLAEALVALGHEVTLLARPGSHASGARVVPLQPGVPLREQLPPGVDLVHTRSSQIPDVPVPLIASVDGNGQPGETFTANTLFVSRKHAENHMSGQFVYNGVDASGYRAEDERGDYAVFLANAAWDVKNVRGAVQVARAAGVRLVVIGGMSRRQRVERYLPHMRGVEWRGDVDEPEKRALLSRARALVFPVRWHEPFGVAVVEALASGCPVLATPYGALPEIVTPDVGVLSADGAELARALRRADEYDAKACRARALDAFTHMHMARACVRHYEAVLRTGRVADPDPQPPRTRPGFEYQRLLPWAQP